MTKRPFGYDCEIDQSPKRVRARRIGDLKTALCIAFAGTLAGVILPTASILFVYVGGTVALIGVGVAMYLAVEIGEMEQ